MNRFDPLDLVLVSGALTLIERESLAFAREYGLTVEGCTSQALAEIAALFAPRTKLRVETTEIRAVADNAAGADLIVILSDSMVGTELESQAAVGAVLGGKDFVTVRPGLEWQDDLKKALTDPGLRRIYITGGSPVAKVEESRHYGEGLAWQLLTAIFNFLEPRDPSASVITGKDSNQRLDALRSRYPYQFPASVPDFMIAPEDGWLDLVEKLCADVDALLPEACKAQFQWKQIKEKFGGLRAYWSRGPLFADLQHAEGGVTTFRFVRDDGDNSLWEQINALIQAATEQSLQVCGECGGPGRLRPRAWMRTLCDLHAKPGWERP